MTEEFRVKENGFDEVKKKILLTTIPITVIAAITGLVIPHFTSNMNSSDVNVLPFVIPLIVVVLSFSIIRALKKQKEIFNSFLLTINENGISREQNLIPKVTIPLSEISRITKNANGSIYIKGSSQRNIIIIPSQVENLESLEEQLSKIKTISIQDKKIINLIINIGLPILILGLMAIVYIGTNELLILISGAILVITLVYTFISIQNSKMLDSKTKNGSWFILLVIISICVIIYNKLFVE